MTTQTQRRKATRLSGNHPKPNPVGSGKATRKAKRASKRANRKQA